METQVGWEGFALQKIVKTFDTIVTHFDKTFNTIFIKIFYTIFTQSWKNVWHNFYSIVKSACQPSTQAVSRPWRRRTDNSARRSRWESIYNISIILQCNISYSIAWWWIDPLHAGHWVPDREHWKVWEAPPEEDLQRGGNLSLPGWSSQVPVQKCVPVPVKVEGQKCVNVPTQSCETVPVVASVPVPQKQVAMMMMEQCWLLKHVAVPVLQEAEEGLSNTCHHEAQGCHGAGKFFL